MIALFFEVLPKPGQEGTYFEMAAKLKPALDASGGLEFLDRSRSTLRPSWFLSHQFWRDEASMARWRANPAHHRAQACGRTGVLDDYRLRVGAAVASVTGGGTLVRAAVPATAAYNDPAVVPERYLVSIVSKAPVAGVAGEAFTSVYDPALTVQVVPAGSEADGLAALSRAAGEPALVAARLCLLSRDYTMRDRGEAPQYFAPVGMA